MEFFREIPLSLSERELLEDLSIDNLSALCACIDQVLAAQGERGEIYCLWGQFKVHRQVIRGGVRFSLPDCPNALAWTVTLEGTPSDRSVVSVHCTINRRTHDADFIESIELFMDDWRSGLEQRWGECREAVCHEA